MGAVLRLTRVTTGTRRVSFLVQVSSLYLFSLLLPLSLFLAANTRQCRDVVVGARAGG